MGKGVEILKKLEEIDQLKKEREKYFDNVSDDFDFETSTRYKRCFCCVKVTEQRVDERTITYEIGDRCNRSFHERTFDTIVGWWCNECDDEVQIIKQLEH